MTTALTPEQEFGRFTYGDAGDRWPVKRGEIWMVGQHVMACGDLERGSGQELLDMQGAGTRVVMAFVDPPWNPANATAFRTKAAMRARVDYQRFRSIVIDLLAKVEGPVWLEMGDRFQPVWLSEAQAKGAQVLAEYRILYYRKAPCTLNLLYWPRAGGAVERVPPNGLIDGLDDTEAPIAACGAHLRRGEYVFDPCVGQGLTALAAEKAGGFCMGLELHPRRLAVALDRLHKAGAGEPRVIGRLETMEGIV